MIKLKEIQSYSMEELLNVLEKNKRSLFELKIKNKLGQLENTASINTTKKTIARIKTQITILENKNSHES